MIRKVTITKELLNNIGEVYLHDAEIKDITFNYCEHKITIPLALTYPKSGSGLLIFNGVSYAEMNCCEPWGAGYYIFELHIENANDFSKDEKCFNNIIELNSGDRINIVSNEMVYTEDI